MSIVYSPLCDTDKSIYLAYLAANLGHGAGTVGDYEKLLTAGDGEVGSCSGDTGGCVSGNCGRVAVCGTSEKMAVVFSSIVAGGFGGIHCNAGDKREWGEGATFGVSCVPLGCCVDCVGHRDSCKFDGNRKVLDKDVGSGEIERDSDVRTSDSRGSDPGVRNNGVVGRGCLQGETTLDRNRRWRREKKERKSRKKVKQLSQAVKSKDWRADRILRDRPGFFSECPREVQDELRKSRAEFLIAKNKKDRILAERAARSLESEVTLVADTLKVLKIQESVEKIRKNVAADRVCGWAKTVLSGASESAVASAVLSNPSLPSLDSVDVSDSVSQVNDEVKRRRAAEYKLALVELEKSADEQLWVNNEDYLEAIAAVKDEYADVAYTETERERKLVVDKILGVLGPKMNAMDFEKLADLGLVDRSSIIY